MQIFKPPDLNSHYFISGCFNFVYFNFCVGRLTIVYVDHALVLELVFHTEKAHVQVAALHVRVVVCRLQFFI